jgi:hypothetical protein
MSTSKWHKILFINAKLKSVLGIIAFFSLGCLLGGLGIIGYILCIPLGILMGINYGDELYGPWFPNIK